MGNKEVTGGCLSPILPTLVPQAFHSFWVPSGAPATTVSTLLLRLLKWRIRSHNVQLCHLGIEEI